jgi:hypothetical protein
MKFFRSARSVAGKIVPWLSTANTVSTFFQKVFALYGVSVAATWGIKIQFPEFFSNPETIKWVAVIATALLLLTISCLVLCAVRILSQNRVSPLFRDLAVQNKDCDADLFRELFVNRRKNTGFSLGDADLSAVEKAQLVVERNIQAVVDYASKIFKQHTGDVCAVSIKMPRSSPTGMVVHGLWRDARSKTERASADDREWPLDANTAFRTIRKDDVEFYACDDLIKAAQNKLYENPRRGWEEDYSATIVYAIRGAGQRRAESPSATANEVVAYFCVDNRSGGFCNTTSHHYMMELRARLEVMLHRSSVLEKLAKESERVANE